jgi:Fe-Mn family superoxide dismutase
MPFTLPELPYAKNSLEPHIQATTFDYHYGKHHQAYVTNLNKMIEGTEYENSSLEDIIVKTYGDPEKTGIYNNAAQIWNHTFYWKSMSPQGGGEASGVLADWIKRDFGSQENLVSEWSKAAATQFGSGWAWLVQEGSHLKVMQTANADTPIAKGLTPLSTIDVWEHAYYLDFQNKRPAYIESFFHHLINWEFAEKNLKA